MTPLRDFYDQLERFDWYFTMSDDHSVYRRGRVRQAELEVVAAESPAHQELYNAFRKHHFSGRVWGNQDALKPEAPTGDA